MPAQMKTILCIPGPWKDHREFILAVAGSSEARFLALGKLMMKVADKTTMEFEVCPRDERIESAFELGGQGKMPPAELQAIADHQSVLYLVSGYHGLDDLHHLHNFANVALAAGGLGLKFENSGTAHGARQWRGYDLRADTRLLMQAHVFLLAGESHFFSCGMHIFGLPDAAVPLALGSRDAGHLLTWFNHYHIFEAPTFRDGQTFSLDAQSPKYRLRLRDDFIYGGEEQLGNPFGRIELLG